MVIIRYSQGLRGGCAGRMDACRRRKHRQERQRADSGGGHREGARPVAVIIGRCRRFAVTGLTRFQVEPELLRTLAGTEHDRNDARAGIPVEHIAARQACLDDSRKQGKGE
jgi:hypothetical protein